MRWRALARWRGPGLARAAGLFLLVDGLLRSWGRGTRLPGRFRTRSRCLGAGELGLGLAVLERAPIEPACLYAAVAPVYDRLMPVWRDHLYREASGAFEAALGGEFPTGGSVLDLGCGTGAGLERLLALDVPFQSYLGVDLSSAMLDRARARFNVVAAARFERRDLRRDGLPAGTFDLVVSAWALEHIDRPDLLVAAARSQLQPWGRLVLLFELETPGLRGWLLRAPWRFYGVRLVSEQEARAWPGLLSFRRWSGVGPDAAVAVLGAPADGAVTAPPA